MIYKLQIKLEEMYINMNPQSNILNSMKLKWKYGQLDNKNKKFDVKNKKKDLNRGPLNQINIKFLNIQFV